MKPSVSLLSCQPCPSGSELAGALRRVPVTVYWPLFSDSLQKTRYEMYVRLLKEGGLELLSSSGGGGAVGLKKSHSSPSLNPDASPVTAKVKRNVSERKDHRPETPGIKQKVT